MPREGDANIDTIQVLEKDGTYTSRREWLQKAAENTDIKAGVEYPLVGSPDLRFKKSENGDIAVYE
jgi:hypothetical protein